VNHPSPRSPLLILADDRIGRAAKQLRLRMQDLTSDFGQAMRWSAKRNRAIKIIRATEFRIVESIFHCGMIPALFFS
jgi:hypothetical protein